MIAPAAESVAAQFGITNDVVIAMTTSVFVLGYGAYPRRFSLLSWSWC